MGVGSNPTLDIIFVFFFLIIFSLCVGQGDLSKSNDAANGGKTATRSGYNRIQAGGYGAPGIIFFSKLFLRYNVSVGI